jgi:hypothetical protein
MASTVTVLSDASAPRFTFAGIVGVISRGLASLGDKSCRVVSDGCMAEQLPALELVFHHGQTPPVLEVKMHLDT